MSLISQRYAAAFYKAGEERNETDTLRQDLTFCRDVMEQNRDLTGYLGNPQFTFAAKQNALRKIFSDRVDPLSLNLLLLLQKNRRLGLLPNISEDFEQLCNQHENTLCLSVTTASPADEETLRAISDKFRTLYGADHVCLTTDVDPTLIGGAVVAVGDKLYDGSLKGKLNGLKTELEER